GSVLAFMIYTLSQDLLYPAVEKDFSSITPVITIIGCALVTFSLLRHRLMDVDVYVSRDVAYNSFVIGVVAVYLVIVGLAAMTIRGLSGISGLQFALLFVYLAVLLLLVAL
ncbi:MAG: hypothetical protein GTO00_10470, partial [Deltaproteobacteria bacterium]|nr:hypothetical protein [Deltaproteobacteria bacterium]